MTKEELFKEAFASIVESDEDRAMAAFAKSEEMGISPMEILTEGYSAGIKHLGDQFGRGEVFLPELMFATEVMKVVTVAIEEKMGEDTSAKKGILVLGTVEGDVHDIGKGIVASLVKSNGIEVIDLGREVPAQVFIDKAKEVGADFIGSSALLTTTMTVQKDIEALLEKEGLKGKIKTMIGGAPVTQRWADRIGADYYCEDASETVKFALEYLKPAQA